MDNKPLASLLVPVYNDEDTIEECLLSLIRQEYTNREIVVIEGGSTDRTAEIVSSMAEKYQSIRIVPGVYRGLTKARNVGLKRAKGDIIVFIEGDGIYNPDYVSKSIRLLMEDPKVGAVCLTGGLWIRKPTIVSECVRIDSGIKRKFLEQGKAEPHFVHVFRRKVVETIGMFDEKMFQAEDKDYLVRIRKAGFGIGLITGQNWYHKRDQSVSSYLGRVYYGSKSRILYIMKYRRIAELLRYIVPLWTLPLLLLMSMQHNSLVSVVLLLILLYILYKLSFAFKYGRPFATRIRYFFAYPFFSSLKYVTIGLGYSVGLLFVTFYGICGRSVDWTAFSRRKPESDDWSK